MRPSNSVPQHERAVAEPVLVDQFQLQPHTIREEPFSVADDRRPDEHLKLVHKTSAVFLSTVSNNEAQHILI
jgi:hypothetical protein